MKRYYTVILSILLLFVFTGCDNENGVISPSATIGWGGSLTERPVQPISFGTVEEALAFIKENDLESYMYEEKEKYSEMITAFRAKGTIPVLSINENINITGVSLNPKLAEEDMGIGYGFLYNDKYYAIRFYFFDSMYSDSASSGIASYEKARFGDSYLADSRNIHVNFMQNEYNSLITKIEDGRMFIRFIFDETYYVRVSNNVNTYEDTINMLCNIDVSIVPII